jgi:GxxExxY protein
MNTDKNLGLQTHAVAPAATLAATPAVNEYPEQELTGAILQAAFALHNTLGAGFLERVYSNALAIELDRKVLMFVQNVQLQVKYRGTIVGDYIADMIVENRVILELKACASLDPSQSAQLMNYLRAANIRVGLLLNFGRPKLEYRRFVC